MCLIRSPHAAASLATSTILLPSHPLALTVIFHTLVHRAVMKVGEVTRDTASGPFKAAVRAATAALATAEATALEPSEAALQPQLLLLQSRSARTTVQATVLPYIHSSTMACLVHASAALPNVILVLALLCGLCSQRAISQSVRAVLEATLMCCFCAALDVSLRATAVDMCGVNVDPEDLIGNGTLRAAYDPHFL